MEQEAFRLFESLLPSGHPRTSPNPKTAARAAEIFGPCLSHILALYDNLTVLAGLWAVPPRTRVKRPRAATPRKEVANTERKAPNKSNIQTSIWHTKREFCGHNGENRLLAILAQNCKRSLKCRDIQEFGV